MRVPGAFVVAFWGRWRQCPPHYSCRACAILREQLAEHIRQILEAK